jgi:hypothetical protein
MFWVYLGIGVWFVLALCAVAICSSSASEREVRR